MFLNGEETGLCYGGSREDTGISFSFTLLQKLKISQ